MPHRPLILRADARGALALRSAALATAVLGAATFGVSAPVMAAPASSVPQQASQMAASAPGKAEAGQVIVFLRHGEKPKAGLGQLSCKGLNRALALPPVLMTSFGRPDMIFAPDPSKLKEDDGTDYAYIRPLATIEPTAIAAGLPVDTSMGFEQIGKLQKALEDASAPHLIVVAWEHKEIVKLVRAMVKGAGGDPDQVPKWKGEDFDSLFVLRRGAAGQLTFEHRVEGLDGQSDTCPGVKG
ncbi:MAG: hypothetical protein PW791_16910 [Neorhizobium sp.]|nr:hypothetical protein [Neorhizobium sp.]